MGRCRYQVRTENGLGSTNATSDPCGKQPARPPHRRSLRVPDQPFPNTIVRLGIPAGPRPSSLVVRIPLSIGYQGEPPPMTITSTVSTPSFRLGGLAYADGSAAGGARQTLHGLLVGHLDLG